MSDTQETRKQFEALVWFINEVSDWAQKHPDGDSKSAEIYAYAEGAAENLSEIRVILAAKTVTPARMEELAKHLLEEIDQLAGMDVLRLHAVEVALREAACQKELESRSAEPTDDKEFYNETRRVMFRAGLLACREYMARFVESESPSIATSIRANWWPCLGDDPGAPRKLRFDEVTDGGENGPWPMKEISPSIEALPVAMAFLVNPPNERRPDTHANPCINWKPTAPEGKEA